MNKAFIDTLDKEGLEHHVRGLNEESEALRHWATLATCPEGVFLLNELTEQLQRIRCMYSKIPISSDYSSIMLAGLQGNEEAVDKMVKKMNDAQAYKKILDAEMDYALECMKTKKDTSERGHSRLVPKEAIEHLKESL